DAERNLLTYLVVDKSGSMAFNGAVQTTTSKLEHASRLAAALGYLVVREGDEVGLSLADTQLHAHLPPSSSWAHLNRILDSLSSARPEGQTDLESCLEQVFARIRRRGVLVIFSDFLDLSEKFWNRIDLFRRSRFDIIFFQVVHPEEIDLPSLAAARFVETEGGRGHFNVEPDSVRELYRRRFDSFLRQVKAGCQARGCDWFLAKTSDKPYAFLRNCFLEREG
ncbi:MAG TPA: VWA domain-containing protein, partial [Patescibacteria group bacterium]|nr:VWA domain-containing protein [Patescibacteria group bacterium]